MTLKFVFILHNKNAQDFDLHCAKSKKINIK